MTAKPASLLAANSHALARSLVAGAAFTTTSRAKRAAGGGTLSLCQRATMPVTSSSTVIILWQVP